MLKKIEFGESLIHMWVECETFSGTKFRAVAAFPEHNSGITFDYSRRMAYRNLCRELERVFNVSLDNI